MPIPPGAPLVLNCCRAVRRGIAGLRAGLAWRGRLLPVLGVLAVLGGSASAEGMRADALAFAAQAQQASAAHQYATAVTLVTKALERQERVEFRYDLACYLALSGDTDRAFATLNTAIDEGYLDAAHLQADPDLQALHPDPRFARALDHLRAVAQALRAKLAAVPPPQSVFSLPEAASAHHRVPLVVALHGVGENPQHFATIFAPWTRASGFALLAIGGSEARSLKGDAFAWTYPRDVERVHAIVGDILAHQPIDPARVYLLGFSQGAVMSYPVAFRDPMRFAGVIAMSGAMMPETIDAAGMAAAATHLPILAFHGEQDGNVLIALDRATQDRLRAAHFTTTLTAFTGGHQFPPDTAVQLTQAIRWLDEHRPAAPSPASPGAAAPGPATPARAPTP